MSKKIKLEPLRTILGKPFKITDVDSLPVEEGKEPKRIDNANILQVVKLLILGIPPAMKTDTGNIQMITMQDSINAIDFFDQAKGASDGVLVVTEGIYDWVKKKIEIYAPSQFGVNAKVIKDAWENLEKSEKNKGA